MIKTGLKRGFTLAEVLTTLMVIGVVAAMTIPTLLNSTDDQQHRVALKKAVSVLSQAVQLNVAKEIDGNIQSSADLCAFFANSMAGSCSTEDDNTQLVTMTTADGMQFAFVYRGDASEHYHDFETVCGRRALSNDTTNQGATYGDWQGMGHSCVVLVDTNGGKTTTGFTVPNNDTSLNSNSADDPIGEEWAKKDQYPLIVTATGVYPAITNADTIIGKRAYTFLYGSDAKTPWGLDFGDEDNAKNTSVTATKPGSSTSTSTGSTSTGSTSTGGSSTGSTSTGSTSTGSTSSTSG